MIYHHLLRPLRCHTCDSPHIGLEFNSVLYGKQVGKWPVIWHCRKCGASVGCHHETDIPLGLMANRVTRGLRKRAHLEFDPLWRRGGMSRNQAYTWLASKLGIDPDSCHISWFDAETCEQVIQICRKARRRTKCF